MNTLSGRDKFAKTTQYSGKLIAWLCLKSNNEELKTIMNNLSSNMSTTRKGFRLLKSINDMNLIVKTLNNSDNKDLLMKCCQIISSIGFIFYWYHDNKIFLIKSKVIKGDHKIEALKGGKWWLLALILHLFILLSKLRNVNKNSDLKNNESKKKKDLFKLKISLICFIGDFICCLNQSQVDKNILGNSFNNGILGVAGLSSALTAIYGIY